MSFSFKGGSILDPVGQDGVTNLMTSLLDEVHKILLHQNIDFSKEKMGLKFLFLQAKKELREPFR